MGDLEPLPQTHMPVDNPIRKVACIYLGRILDMARFPCFCDWERRCEIHGTCTLYAYRPEMQHLPKCKTCPDYRN